MARPFSALVIRVGSIELRSGSVDPSQAPGVAAPIGSVYFRDDPPQTYRKFTAPDTGWALEGSSAPVNTVPPTITGSVEAGQVLTTVNGTWTGTPTPTFTRQWLRDGSSIVGETALTYQTADPGDIGTSIQCRWTGTNSIGAASADSNTIVIEAPEPATQQPAIAFGGTALGAAMTTDLGGATAGFLNFTICLWIYLEEQITQGCWLNILGAGGARRAVLEFNNVNAAAIADSLATQAWADAPPLNQWLFMTFRGPAVWPGQLVGTWTPEDGTGGVRTATLSNGIEESVEVTSLELSNDLVLTCRSQYVRAYTSRLTDQAVEDERVNDDPAGCYFWAVFQDDGGGGVECIDATGNGRVFTIGVDATFTADGPTCPTVI